MSLEVGALESNVNANNDSGEQRWVFGWALAAVFLASLPYLWGWYITPPGYVFLGLTHNIDDGAVYLSWIRQIADGRLTYINLFTAEHVQAHQFNVLFLAMGLVARLTHISVIWVYHLFRALLGFFFVLVAWLFSKQFFESNRDRKLFVPLLCFSSGIGWLFLDYAAPTGPVDNWQPEAITFLSMYLNPLFLCSLILMVLVFHFLNQGRRAGRSRHYVCAGLFLLLLGNIHTYDVVTVAAVWIVYLLCAIVIDRRVPKRDILLSLLAGLVALPSIGYQLYLYKIDEVFRARANSPAPSPQVCAYFAGYGLVFAFALLGGWALIRRADRRMMLPLVWSTVGFALPYLPIAQQRKLVMGLHIPLCILCVYGLTRGLERVPEIVRWAIACTVILFSLNSNFAFLARDIGLLNQGRTVTHYLPYATRDEMAAMQWLKHHGSQGHIVFASPTFSLFTPALAGLKVYYGHWSETPNYASKLREWMAFIDESTDVRIRLNILRRTKARFYVSGPPAEVKPQEQLAETMHPVCRYGDVTIYELCFAK